MAKQRTKTMSYSNTQNNRLASNGYSLEIQNKYKLPEGSTEFSPSFADIQVRAYELYKQRGGSDIDNWLEAERLLKEENS